MGVVFAAIKNTRKMTLHLNTPKPYDVLSEMKDKGIKATELIKETGLSSRTFYRFINEEGSTQRTIETITNYINQKQKS